MMIPIEPSPEIDSGRIRRISSREAASGKAKPVGLGSYCFLKALRFIHHIHLHRSP
jgi:hypothetical protein